MVLSFAKNKNPTSDVAAAASSDLKKFLDSASTVLAGKHSQLHLAWSCVVAGGHLLIEDLPGMGKTTMVKTIARLLDLPWKRIQCTSDLLPADITGGNIFDEFKKEFLFIRGPIFANLVMADELNRASPKSQSAFLQAMEEMTITVDGTTHSLPDPFVVIATQNSLDSAGTNPLPESQLDRFMMSLSLGLPSRDVEKQLLTSRPRIELLEELNPVMNLSRLIELRKAVSKVHVGDQVAEYLLDLAGWIRARSYGFSPRTMLALTASSKAWALGLGRDFVMPSDVKAVAPSVLVHRLASNDSQGPMTSKALVSAALQSVEVES